MSVTTFALKPVIETKKKKSIPMADTSNLQIDSPSSISSSSNGSGTTENQSSIPSIAEPTTIIGRRSQRRRTNIQPPMRSSSLTTTIFHENSRVNECLLETTKENNNHQQQQERRSSPVVSNKLALASTSTATTPKSSYWTVTDRQAEWYKLSLPVNQPTTNNSTGPSQSSTAELCRTLAQPFPRKKSTNDQLDEPADTTQLIMKAVMQDLDYDMDEDDLVLLDELNRYAQNHQQRTMTEEDFENAIIILEFYAAEKIRSHLKQRACEDEDIVCDICLLPDGDDGNEMVFCERCNCCVHQSCYGISVVPSGTWLCKACSILRRPACILCPKMCGPMKCSPSGTVWCHLTCALWLPELKFADYMKMEPILNLDKISHARWSLRCVVCSTSEGACVQCAHKNCRTPFHVTCGLAAGYFLDIQQTSSEETTNSRSQFNAYCFKHSDEARLRCEQDPTTTTASSFLPSTNDDDDSSCTSTNGPLSSIIPLTVYRRSQLKNQQWTIECEQNFHTFVSSSHLHDECPQDYDEYVSKMIYNYWVEKRSHISNRSMPLVKRIDYVLEQRENAELLLAQISHCLRMRKKMRELQLRCKSVLSSSSSSSASFVQRLQTLKQSFASSSSSRRRRRSSDSVDNELLSVNKRRRQKIFYSNQQHAIVERAKRCVVALETTYRDGLELNTTYLVGKTMEGQMILLPKQLIEQANIITMTTDDLLHHHQTNNSLSPMIYSDVSNDDDDDIQPPPIMMKSNFTSTKIPYTSRGNVVTCVTGSFD